MKYLIIFLVVLMVGAWTYMYKSNQESKKRLEDAAQAYKEQQAQVASEIKADQEKYDKEEAHKKLALDKENKAVAKQRQIEENNLLKEKEKNKKELDAYEVVLRKWMQQDSIATSTARVALSTPVTELRKIRDELDKTEITGCLAEAKSSLLSSMDDEIMMFVYFMQNNVLNAKKKDELQVSSLNKMADSMNISNKCRKNIGN